MAFRKQTAAPGAAPRLSLAADCAVLALASIASSATAGGVVHWGSVVTMAPIALAGWLLGSRILHQYDVFKAQGLAGDLVLTSVLVLAVASTLALFRATVDGYAADATLKHFLAVLWSGTLLLRITLPRGRGLARHEPNDTLVIGVGPLGRHTARQIRAQKSSCGAICHLSFVDEVNSGRVDGRILGTSDDLDRILRERVFGEVYIAGNSLRHGSAMQTSIRVCERFGIPFALPASHFRFDRARPADARAISDGYVHYLSVEHKPYQMAVKRVLDILVSSCVLVLLSPLLLVVAALIALTSPGPILFRQERVGRYGRTFRMLKFRSMVVNAEALRSSLMTRNEQAGPVFKIKKDPRVTRVGSILRKYSIDELPQLVNVLRGDMALVGPRPPLPREVEKYEAWQRRRLSVRPGLTCVWQVSGRNNISFEEWMYLDMRYIDHWSIAEDIKLILKTVPVVIAGRGAS